MSLEQDDEALPLHDKLAIGAGIMTFVIAWILCDLGTGILSGIFTAILAEGLIELVVVIALYLKSDR